MLYFSSPVEDAIQTILNELDKDIYENYFTYRLIKRENLKSLCAKIKAFFHWDFNFQEFYKNLCDKPQLPLELLWNFHVFQIIPLDIYLLNSKSKFSSQNFKENIIVFCTEDCENDALSFSQTGLMSFIVSHAFPDSDECLINEDMKLICRPIVESFLESIFFLSEKDFNLGRLKTFLTLWVCGTIGVGSLRSFSYFSLQKFLSESSSSVEDAFIPHSAWRNKSDPFHLQPAIQKIVETLDPEELGQIFNKAVSIDDINWKNLAIFIASMSDEGSLVKKIVADLIKDGFDHLNFMSIQKAVLIGRQISLKSKDSFPNAYTSWMQNNIWGNIQTKSFQAVSLLIQVLSGLVPYEKDADYIKLFLGRPVNIPQECQSLYSDYVTLLKTRVKDLQPCINTEKILEKALNIFKENGKIPPYVLQASLMNKHHYLNEFLPILLKPRVIPAVPDVKEKLIEKLNKSGKIPSYMYRQYKFSCQQEQQNLLAGLNLADDNFIELIDDDIQMTD